MNTWKTPLQWDPQPLLIQFLNQWCLLLFNVFTFWCGTWMVGLGFFYHHGNIDLPCNYFGLSFSFWDGTWMPCNNLGFLLWNIDILLNLNLIVWRLEPFGLVILFWRNERIICYCYYLNFYYLIYGWIINLDTWELIAGYSG